MAFDEELGERVGLSFNRLGAEFEAKKMMGGLCFMVDDKMTLGLIQDDLMVRLSHEDVEAALEEPECRPLDFTSRPMKGFLIVEGDAVARDHALDHWVERALAFNPFAKRSKKRKP